MRILLLLLLFWLFGSQVQSQVCSVTGKVSAGAQIIISYEGSTFLDFVRDTIVADSGGHFTYSVRLANGPRRCYLNFSDKELTVWAVDAKDISMEASADGKISFFGETREVQHYLLNNHDQWSEIYNNIERNDIMHDLSKPHSDQYFDIQDQITAARIDYLHNSISTSGIDSTINKSFIRREEQDLIYHNLYYKLNFNNPKLAKFKFSSTRTADPNVEYYGYTEDNPFDKRQLLESRTFLGFANLFFIQTAAQSLKKVKVVGNRESYYYQVFSVIDSITHDDYCRQIHKIFFLQDELKDLALGGSVSDLTPALFKKYLGSVEKLPSAVNEMVALKRLFQEKQDALARLTNIRIANCAVLDEFGKQFDLASLRGRLVYINVWASWCGPCIESLPDWNLLVKQWAEDKNVVFLMISIDSSPEKWKSALNKYQPTALQLISPGDFEKSDFAGKLNIRVLPTYLLIDKNGKTISTRAARPTEIQLTTFLETFSR
jgi:thiol-disulfide isomerase/thioredoxin